MPGSGTGEVYRDTLTTNTLLGHFYWYYRQLEIRG